MTQKLITGICAKSLHAFIEKAFRSMHREPLSKDQLYIRFIVLHLERFLQADTKKLLVNLPGRHLKTFICSVCFPAFALGLDPTLKFMIVACTKDLAEDIVRQIRELMQSAWYKAVFKTRISQGHSQKHDFSVEGGGRVRAVAVRSVTGKGGDYVIFDDAHNIDDWDNERKKQRVIEAFELLVSRRDRGKKSSMLVVGHRVAEDDVSAHILERGDFRHVCLPLYAPENMSLDLGDSTWELSKGEALRPDAFPPDEIDSIRRYHCGPPFWLFYQQGLGPRDGDFEIKVSDFPLLPRAPYGRKPPKELPVMLSVDPANKTGSSSRNVIHVYVIRGDQYELIRAWAEKCTSLRLAKKVMQLAARYDAWFIFVEATARGPDLIYDLRKELSIPIIPIQPRGTKMDRLRKCAPIICAKRIHVRRTADVEEAVDEIVSYPDGLYDDHLDALTNFLLELPKITPPATVQRPAAGPSATAALGSRPRPHQQVEGAVIVRGRSIFGPSQLPDFSNGLGDDAPIYVMIEGKKVRIR